MRFADRAKALYDKGNITQKEIAENIGISESMVSRYLNGSVEPRADIAEKMLKLLGADEAKQKLENATDMRTALALIRDTYEGRIADLKEDLRAEKREKWIFVVLLMVVVSFVFLLLYVDVTNGNVGWFRY